jgi:hypothetical protein
MLLSDPSSLSQVMQLGRILRKMQPNVPR